MVQYISAYYRWGNRQCPLFILSIRVWQSAVLREKSSYHHHPRTVVSSESEPGVIAKEVVGEGKEELSTRGISRK
jgi:hypothetical protein